MNNEVIHWWLSQQPFSKEEQSWYEPCTIPFDNTYSEEDNTRFVSYLLGKVPSDFIVRMAPSATDIINSLFAYYVDDDTLVISTNIEHPSVVKNLSLCKNMFKLNLHSDCNFLNVKVINDILHKVKSYKRVFIYMIGMTNDGSLQTSMEFHRRLRSVLLNAGIDHVYVYDDVQGFFYLPRDYSLFDFVIATGHAPVAAYDLGFVLYRSSTEKKFIPGQFGKKRLQHFLRVLDATMKRKEKELLFESVMRMYFEGNPYIKFLPSCCPFRCLFTLPIPMTFEQGVKYFNSDESDVAYCTPDSDYAKTGVHKLAMRSHMYLRFPDMLYRDLHKINRLIAAYGLTV